MIFGANTKVTLGAAAFLAIGLGVWQSAAWFTDFRRDNLSNQIETRTAVATTNAKLDAIEKGMWTIERQRAWSYEFQYANRDKSLSVPIPTESGFMRRNNPPPAATPQP